MSAPFTVAARLRSFRYAANGVWLTLKTQHNAWVHAGATLAVICAGFVLGISRTDWCVLVLACAAVWTAEALNTAFEYLADATTKKFDPLIGRAKDVAAGAVLITAIAALIVGALVLTPYIVVLIRSTT
jgi:diacylglycerol kinase (ATP)